MVTLTLITIAVSRCDVVQTCGIQLAWPSQAECSEEAFQPTPGGAACSGSTRELPLNAASKGDCTSDCMVYGFTAV